MILKDGFEEQVRVKLGVTDEVLPDEAINTPMISKMAETVVKKRVPSYADIVDESDLFFLEAATISYICYLLAPSMPNRIQIEVSTLDVKWKYARIDWVQREKDFLMEFESYLDSITSVTVVAPTAPLLVIGGSSRQPLGEW